jgi:hypothetical protein
LKTVSFIFHIFSSTLLLPKKSPPDSLEKAAKTFSSNMEKIQFFIRSLLQVIGRQQRGKSGGSESQSQSSICSTPGQSSASNKISSDWPDPPDIPICSTEDEAASLYSHSDSGEFKFKKKN